jgi:TrmH family RNA methyltransferase
VPSPLSLLTREQAAHIRSLIREKRVRQADGAFVMEGAKAVRDLLAHHPSLVCAVLTTPSYREKEQLADRQLREGHSTQTLSCSDQTFAKLSNLDSTQGILAIVQQPVWNEQQIIRRPTIFGIYGEQIQDPLNVGAIIRTAAALNVTALWLTRDSADWLSPKVVRATSGALLSLPIFWIDNVEGLLREGCSIYAAEATGRETISMQMIVGVPKRLILAVGNEGKGLSEKTRQSASRRFTIPLARRVESLNVAATVAIATYVLGNLPKES